MVAAAGLGAMGVVILTRYFDADSPWFFVGLTQLLAAGHCLNAGLNHRRTRTLDAEYDAGYRVGFRAGRRAAKLKVVHHLDDERRRRARIQKAAVRALASDGALARREAPHSD